MTEAREKIEALRRQARDAANATQATEYQLRELAAWREAEKDGQLTWKEDGE